MGLTPEQEKELKDLTFPLMVFMRNNYHPHTHIAIDGNRAEVFEGLLNIVIDTKERE